MKVFCVFFLSICFRYCSTYVGRRRGVMPVYIGPACYRNVGSVIHELLHVLGFYHEQSRPDRDDYVEIITDNIRDYERNKRSFRKYPHGHVETFNISYDLDSIMHYGNEAFSKDPLRLKTIVAKHDPNKVLGQRDAMTPTDINQLNLLYSCPPPRPKCDTGETLRYGEMMSLQYKPNKWVLCNRGTCLRKTCHNFSTSNCEAEPTGCMAAKYRMQLVEKDGNRNEMRNGDKIRIVHAYTDPMHPGDSLQCGHDIDRPNRCSFNTCPKADDSICRTNTFTVHKRMTSSEQKVAQNDVISLCQPSRSGNTAVQSCLSCSRPVYNPELKCRLVQCTRDLKGCEGIYFKARQWPSADV